MKTLTPEQLEALRIFSIIMGRCWKKELRYAWMTGKYPAECNAPALQQVRNSFGPSWLVRFSLKEALA